MALTLNVKARNFALRELFESEPDEGFFFASVALRELAARFCKQSACEEFRFVDNVACRRHAQAMIRGVSKQIVDGEVLAELSDRGVVYCRLSARGVLEPLSWSRPPEWIEARPELVEWAREHV